MDAEVIERLARIETHLETLVGNGQPGRIGKLESEVELLKAAHNRTVGASAVLGALSGFVAHYLGFHR